MVNRLNRFSWKYSLLINVDNTKVMENEGRILIQNEQLELVDMFPYLGSQITEDGECMMEFTIGATLQKIRKSHNIPISTKI